MKNPDPPIGSGSKILLTIGAGILVGYPLALYFLSPTAMLLYTVLAFAALLAVLS